MGGHTVALTISQWMSLPVIGLARLGFWVRNYAQRATSKFTEQYIVARFFVQALATLLTAISYLLLSGFKAAQALNSKVGRASEYRADARAAQMGFGNELISALRNVDKHEIQKGMRLRPMLSTSTHPPAGTRVAKLEALLKRDVAHKRRSIRRHQ
jgi:Zn-dependent protease with chaperone function